jgi:hypothetical protein
VNPISLTGKEARSTSMRFGILCSSTHFQKWQADAIHELVAHGHIAVLLILDGRDQPKKKKESFLYRYTAPNLLFRILQNRFFQPDAKRLVNLFSFLEGIDMLTCFPETKKGAEYFQEAETEAIQLYDLDFILRFGFNILRGTILNITRYGIWSFHHDDEMNYRGGPPGFWEIFRSDPVNGAILQRITEKLDAGIILCKGYLKTMLHSYQGNVEQLLTVTSAWPALMADEILRYPDRVYSLSETKAPVYKVPGNFQMVRFLLKLLVNRIRFHYKDLLAAEIWNVGLIHKPIHEIVFGLGKLRNSDITWFHQFDRAKYLADPFGFFEDHKLHIFVEDYSYSNQQANISEIIYDIHKDSFSVPIILIEGEKHLSYPFIVKHKEIVYCIPESHRSKNIELYYRNKSEEAFTKDRILVSNVDAIDPTLFSFEDHWWLFFTLRKHSNTHLYIYFSDSLKGEYVPHARNPVKIDVRSSRPGGTPFIHDGNLYRPAQDCSITYGGRVVINKVNRLTPSEFEEEPITMVNPLGNSPFPNGLHTISQVGTYTLIDGKRYRLNRFFFKNQLRAKLRKRDSGDV